ncbi:MAG: hypothetical protein ACK45H_03540, partial [Bacteroidota bacterium]
MRMNRSAGFLVLLLLCYSHAQAQPDTSLHFPIENSNDPTQTATQSFDLGDPSSVEQTIVYDPTTGTYIFKETIGTVNY